GSRIVETTTLDQRSCARPRASAELGRTGRTSNNPTPSPEVVMRKVILVPALLCGMAVIAGAQTKITGKLTCAKPSVSERGGEGAQMIMFQKSNCTWTTPFTIDGSAWADVSGHYSLGKGKVKKTK